jgi:hypothetical protein
VLLAGVVGCGPEVSAHAKKKFAARAEKPAVRSVRRAGDPAAYVKQQLRTSGSGDRSEAGRIRMQLPADTARRWMALLDAPIEVLGPPAMTEAARTVVARLGAAA